MSRVTAAGGMNVFNHAGAISGAIGYPQFSAMAVIVGNKEPLFANLSKVGRVAVARLVDIFQLQSSGITAIGYPQLRTQVDIRNGAE